MSHGARSCARPARRQFLGGLGALGVGMFGPACAPSSSTPDANDNASAGSKQRRIDVHHHFGSPAWIKVLRGDGALSSSYEGYSPANAIEAMDKGGTQTAIASVTTPGVWFVEGYENGRRQAKHGWDDARSLARETNEFGARMKADYPGRFGIWASLPLPDIEGSLKEIEHALDTLKLEGIGLMTSFGNRWLGDPMFTPVFEELNRRKAVVYTHPTAAPCCRDLIPGLGVTAIEYNTDTTRTIMSWIVSGSAKRFPDVTFIFSHGGGTLPYLASRLTLNLDRPVEPDSRLSYIRKYYYDTCASENSATMGALKEVVGASQIVWGTDYPHGGNDLGAIFKEVEDTGVFNAAELQGVARENALRFLPQYA